MKLQNLTDQVSIALIVSEFNEEITSQLLLGAKSQLLAHGLAEQQIKIITVPGAVEIPLAAKLLAKTKRYHAIIGLGAVIRGDTDHYQYVCQQVSDGCQRVMLESEIPVIFGVLTTETLEQAQDRAGGREGHKGKDAADAAIKMIQVCADIEALIWKGI